MQIATTEYDLIDENNKIFKKIRALYDAEVKEAPTSEDNQRQINESSDDKETDKMKVQRMDTDGGMDSRDFNIWGNIRVSGQEVNWKNQANQEKKRKICGRTWKCYGKLQESSHMQNMIHRKVYKK